MEVLGGVYRWGGSGLLPLETRGYYLLILILAGFPGGASEAEERGKLAATLLYISFNIRLSTVRMSLQ